MRPAIVLGGVGTIVLGLGVALVVMVKQASDPVVVPAQPGTVATPAPAPATTATPALPITPTPPPAPPPPEVAQPALPAAETPPAPVAASVTPVPSNQTVNPDEMDRHRNRRGMKTFFPDKHIKTTPASQRKHDDGSLPDPVPAP